MTPIQCRMARASLRWSQNKLAEKSGVCHITLFRLENNEGVKRSTENKVKAVFEEEGLKFLDSIDGAPAVGIVVPKNMP